MRRCSWLAVTFLVFIGCATRQTAPGVYRLVGTGPSRLLVPPGVVDSTLQKRTFDFALQQPHPKCSATAGPVQVTSRVRSLRLTVDREALLAHPAPWLTNWTSSLEEQGCLSRGEGAVLAERIVESVPLKPADTYRLLHAGGAVAGYQDLGDGYRLKVISSILREGAAPGASALSTEAVTGNDHALSISVKASADFLGYEISWYAVEGSRIVFASGESHIGDQVSSLERPRTNYFSFPEPAAFYRLFYLTRVSHADHDIAILGAPSLGELDRQTSSFASDPDACTKAPRGMCIGLPKQVAVTAYMRVMANGAPLDVAAASTVAAVLHAAGIAQPASVLSTLTVRRRFHGNLVPVDFDRSKEDILALMMAAREELRW